MCQLINFPAKEKPDPELIRRLEILLHQARHGKIKSAAWLVENSNGTQSYGVAGDYLVNPGKAFVPATKGMFDLCVHIADMGQKV